MRVRPLSSLARFLFVGRVGFLPRQVFRAVPALIFLAGACAFPSRAQQPDALLPLPQLGSCKSQTHPLLPEKWRATYLMAPFIQSQLVLGNIEVDSLLQAMRVRLYGVQRGALDLFVLGNDTYTLDSDGGAIKQCRR